MIREEFEVEYEGIVILKRMNDLKAYSQDLLQTVETVEDKVYIC